MEISVASESTHDQNLSDLLRMQLETCWSCAVGDATHIVNIHISQSLKYAKELEQSGAHRPRSLMRGPAVPAANESSEELKALGLVGIYKQAGKG